MRYSVSFREYYMSANTFDVEQIGPRIRALREQRGLSMRELAAKSQVSASFVSKIESCKASPTVVSLMKLLDAMDLGLHEFFQTDKEDNPVEMIVFPREQMAVSEDSQHAWFYAFPRHPDIKMNLSYEEFKAHTRLRAKETHKHDLCGFVISGELTVDIPSRGRFVAKAGDAFYIPAGLMHIAGNRANQILKLVAIQTT
jgi:transcriptional regulator with XRE-family HTH domain